MVEEETPSLAFEMSGILVKLLLLVSEFCFPENERALSWIFSENEEKQRRINWTVSNELELLARNRQSSIEAWKKAEIEPTRLYNYFYTSKLVTGNSMSNEIGI